MLLLFGYMVMLVEVFWDCFEISASGFRCWLCVYLLAMCVGLVVGVVLVRTNCFVLLVLFLFGIIKG